MAMRAPWHLWVVGVLALLWNAFGAYDYLMSQTGNVAYLAMMTEAQRTLMDARPLWVDVFWAIGVWGAVLASVLLLLRSGLAVTAFVVSLIGFIGGSVWSYFIVSPGSYEVSGAVSVILSVVIALSLILCWFYARAMAASGVLR
jgi:hypothetical protein